MSQYGVQLNSRIMFTFLQGCWVARLNREQVARVFAEVAAMRAQQRPDRGVYAALLTFANRHSVPDLALDVWVAMQEASPRTFFGRHQCRGLANPLCLHVCVIIRREDRHGGLPVSKVHTQAQDCGFCTCTVIAYFWEAWRECEKGWRVGCRTMWCQMSTCSRRCSLCAQPAARPTCCGWLTRQSRRCTRGGMCSRPLARWTGNWQSASHDILLCLYQIQCIHSLCLIILQAYNVPTMIGWDCRGWRIAYNAVLNLHAKCGHPSRAEATYKGMLSHGPAPDDVSVNCTIAAHAHVSPPPCSAIHLSPQNFIHSTSIVWLHLYSCQGLLLPLQER